jgi:hypothetical protein
MPGPKLFGMEDAGEEETEPPTGRVVHETAKVHQAACRHGGGVARRWPPGRGDFWILKIAYAPSRKNLSKSGFCRRKGLAFL